VLRIRGRFWRSVAYLLSTVPVAAVASVPLGLLGLPWLGLVFGGAHVEFAGAVFLFLLGAALLAGLGPLVAVPLGIVERARVGIMDDRPLSTGHRWGRGVLRWYREEATWRELAYGLLLVTVVPTVYAGLSLVILLVVVVLTSPLLVNSNEPMVLGAVTIHTPQQAMPYAIVALMVLPLILPLIVAVASGQAFLARVLLKGSGLVEVTRSRARLVDTFESERRRIERDLHDGAQQRLVALTLQLGLARHDLPPDSPAAAAVTSAHEQAKQLMEELRDTIRGIYPQVLTDSGVEAALNELAVRSAVPVRVDSNLAERPPARVETAAYFMVAEALSNVAKHSGATTATIKVRREGRLLVVEVTDDGHGGADPKLGSGLTGLADRAAASDGRMLLSSPLGGPTVLRLELPCG
jgi:signal transduction histidine kinase